MTEKPISERAHKLTDTFMEAIHKPFHAERLDALTQQIKDAKKYKEASPRPDINAIIRDAAHNLFTEVLERGGSLRNYGFGEVVTLVSVHLSKQGYEQNDVTRSMTRFARRGDDTPGRAG